MKTKACPECGGVMELDRMEVSTPIAQAFHVKGTEIPRRVTTEIVWTCAGCGHCEVAGR